MEVKAETLLAVIPLHHCTIQHKVSNICLSCRMSRFAPRHELALSVELAVDNLHSHSSHTSSPAVTQQQLHLPVLAITSVLCRVTALWRLGEVVSC